MTTDITTKRYQIDLDKEPELRWKDAILENKDYLEKAIQEAEKMLGNGLLSWLVSGFFSFLTHSGLILYAEEIKGIANLLNIPLGKVAILQLAYEVNTCCTSILIETNQVPQHIRTMDWDMKSLIPMTIEVEFIKNGKQLFLGTTWPGYVGILTGMRPDGYGVSVNYRRVGDSLLTNLWKGASSAWPASFLLRHVLSNCDDYPSAVDVLSRAKLMAPIYFIISGCKKGEGIIITRDRDEEVSRITLRDCQVLVQTNIDHWRDDSPQHQWQNIEFSLERREFAYQWLFHKIGKKRKIEKADLWKLVHTHPILASDTLYFTYICPGKGEYETQKR